MLERPFEGHSGAHAEFHLSNRKSRKQRRCCWQFPKFQFVFFLPSLLSPSIQAPFICIISKVAWGALCNVKLILYVNTAQMQIDFKKSAFECVGRRRNWSRFHEYASWASYFMEMYGNHWRPGRVKKHIQTCEMQKSARMFTSAVVKTAVYAHTVRVTQKHKLQYQHTSSAS